MKIVFSSTYHQTAAMNKRIFIVLLFLAISIIPCKAQLSLINDKTAEQIYTLYTVTKDVAYGPDHEQRMDIYISGDARDLGKRNFTVVFCHGGGYYLSDKAREERYIQPYLSKGINVVNINYRLKKGIPTATEDLTHALNFLSKNSALYPLKMNRVIVTGFSAGGHISGNVGLSQNNPEYPHRLGKGISIVGVINFSGPVDGLDVVEKVFMDHELPIMKEIGNALFPSTTGYVTKEITSIYEPISYFDKKDPPFFLWYGGKDEQIPPTTFQKFVPLLNEDKGKNVVIFSPDGVHSPNEREFQDAYKEIFLFLDRLN
jgi:acetyl esterase/lipase